MIDPSLPRLTADLPGVAGRLRARDEDFRVEEIPAYAPEGQGDHTYLLVRKRGMATPDACRLIARALGRRPEDVGYAGLKDKHAVTVQTFSVEHVAPAAAREALNSIEGLEVLETALHRNKLRLGHLRGNRFDVVLRGVTGDALPRASAVLERLTRVGCPNGFGEQRFGMRGDNHLVGRALVRDEPDEVVRLLLDAGLAGARDERAGAARAAYLDGQPRAAAGLLPPPFATERRMLDDLARGRTPAQALRGIQRHVSRLLVSAYQSALFNCVLAQRMPHIDRLETGDLAWLHDRGAVFRVTDAALEQTRCGAFEVSPTGPLPGLGSLLADGEPGARERALLEGEGLTPASFKVRGVGRFEGERRPLRMPVADAEALAFDDDGERCLRLRFALPRGSYATAVLHEVRGPAEPVPGPR